MRAARVQVREEALVANISMVQRLMLNGMELLDATTARDKPQLLSQVCACAACAREGSWERVRPRTFCEEWVCRVEGSGLRVQGFSKECHCQEARPKVKMCQHDAVGG